MYTFTVQLERRNIQEKLDSCIADLEAERLECCRLRREEIDRQLENRSSSQELRTEIIRLQNDLRVAE